MIASQYRDCLVVSLLLGLTALVLACGEEEPELDTEYQQCLDDENFEKPEHEPPEPMEFHTVDDFDTKIPNNVREFAHVREHMATPAPGPLPTTSIDEDEYYVLDGYWFLSGLLSPPREHEVQVLHEDRRLPFRIVQIDEEDPHFPSIEEIESWGDDDFDTVADVMVEPAQPVNFTIAIPPESFEKPGVYHLQIISRAKWAPDEDIESPSAWYDVNPWFQRFDTVYYGSECELPDSSEIPDRTDDAEIWTEWDGLGPILFFNRGLFLAPPTDVHDWTQIDETGPPEVPQDADLDQLFESTKRTVTFELYLADVRQGWLTPQPPAISNQTMYSLMRDGEIIDVFTLDGVPEADAEELFDREVAGKVVPIEVELTDEPATYNLYAFPQPFEIFDPGGDANHRELRPISAPAIQMKYDPD